MEELAHATTANAFVAICVLLALNLVARVGEFLWKLKEKKDSATEKGIESLTLAVNLNTKAAEDLKDRIIALEGAVGDVTKVKLDIRRAFFAIKAIAGDNWPEIRKEMMDYDN